LYSSREVVLITAKKYLWYVVVWLKFAKMLTLFLYVCYVKILNIGVMHANYSLLTPQCG
jgi:hypothetical protein